MIGLFPVYSVYNTFEEQKTGVLAAKEGLFTHQKGHQPTWLRTISLYGATIESKQQFYIHINEYIKYSFKGSSGNVPIICLLVRDWG